MANNFHYELSEPFECDSCGLTAKTLSGLRNFVPCDDAPEGYLHLCKICYERKKKIENAEHIIRLNQTDNRVSENLGNSPKDEDEIMSHVIYEDSVNGDSLNNAENDFNSYDGMESIYPQEKTEAQIAYEQSEEELKKYALEHLVEVMVKHRELSCNECPTPCEEESTEPDDSEKISVSANNSDSKKINPPHVKRRVVPNAKKKKAVSSQFGTTRSFLLSSLAKTALNKLYESGYDRQDIFKAILKDIVRFSRNISKNVLTYRELDYNFCPRVLTEDDLDTVNEFYKVAEERGISRNKLLDAFVCAPTFIQRIQNTLRTQQNS